MQYEGQKTDKRPWLHSYSSTFSNLLVSSWRLQHVTAQKIQIWTNTNKRRTLLALDVLRTCCFSTIYRLFYLPSQKCNTLLVNKAWCTFNKNLIFINFISFLHFTHIPFSTLLFIIDVTIQYMLRYVKTQTVNILSLSAHHTHVWSYTQTVSSLYIRRHLKIIATSKKHVYRNISFCVDIPSASLHSILFNKWFREFTKNSKSKLW